MSKIPLSSSASVISSISFSSFFSSLVTSEILVTSAIPCPFSSYSESESENSIGF